MWKLLRKGITIENFTDKQNQLLFYRNPSIYLDSHPRGCIDPTSPFDSWGSKAQRNLLRDIQQGLHGTVKVKNKLTDSDLL